jgi:hypothetical protein
MARVQGVKEKLHLPLYDAFFIPAPKNGDSPPTFASVMRQRDGRVLRFFVDTQNKTKLETNLQASGVLPSQNTFEARALRVVASAINKVTRVDDIAGGTTDNILADLIYNSVTTLIVGEKVMIEMPTFYFPAGAGLSPGSGTVTSHGSPDPMATFRFAEAVPIAENQSFRVEMLFPQGVPGDQGSSTVPIDNTLAAVQGPFRIWVVLDGYLTRDVQ